MSPIKARRKEAALAARRDEESALATSTITSKSPHYQADRSLFGAAEEPHRKNAGELTYFMRICNHVCARLWWACVNRDMSVSRRAQVRPAMATKAKGECVDISRLPTRTPYRSKAGSKAVRAQGFSLNASGRPYFQAAGHLMTFLRERRS